MSDRSDSEENYSTLNDFLRTYPKEFWLETVFGENIENIGFLKEKFKEVKRGGTNDYFVTAISASRRYFISVDPDNDDILIYSKDEDGYKIGNDNLMNCFDWSYPDLINVLGKSRGHSTEEIVNDFKSVSPIDFHLKYVYGIDNVSWCDKPMESHELAAQLLNFDKDCFDGVRVYALSDSVAVSIDYGHVYLFITNDGKIDFKSLTFISDRWFYTDKQILYRLRFMPIMRYGKEMVAYWVDLPFSKDVKNNDLT